MGKEIKNKEVVYKVLPEIQLAMKALKNEGEWLYAINQDYIQVSGNFFYENFGYGNPEKKEYPYGDKQAHCEVEYAGLRIIAVVNEREPEEVKENEE